VLHKQVCVALPPGAEPMIAPESTRQTPAKPSQPLRSFPLKNAAAAAVAEAAAFGGLAAFDDSGDCPIATDSPYVKRAKHTIPARKRD
jgi:hypothetical protein